jgi:nicotinamidase/pyrazinamidase
MMQHKMALQSGDALIIVDVQNDFLPGGALAVPHGDEVVERLNRYITLFQDVGLPIYASRDWHPPNHCSFTLQGGPWPPHCLQKSEGAQFASALHLPAQTQIISKATRPDRDAYSAFEETRLDAQLKKGHVRRLFIGGLATDYCILITVKEALALHYQVYVLNDAIRAVNLKWGDGERAIAEMHGLGAEFIEVPELEWISTVPC